MSNYLASVDRWVRVTAVEGTIEGDGTKEVEMEVADVTPEREGASRRETVLIHSDFVGWLEEALEEGSDVYAAIDEQGHEPDGITSYVLTRDSEGDHHFPGLGCSWEGLLRQQLDDRYNETIDSLIGVTSPAQIKGLLAQGD